MGHERRRGWGEEKGRWGRGVVAKDDGEMCICEIEGSKGKREWRLLLDIKERQCLVRRELE